MDGWVLLEFCSLELSVLLLLLLEREVEGINPCEDNMSHHYNGTKFGHAHDS